MRLALTQILALVAFLAPVTAHSDGLDPKCLTTCETTVIQNNPQCGHSPIGESCRGLLQSQVEACAILKCKVGSEFELGGEAMGPKMCDLLGAKSRKPASQTCFYKR